MYKLSGYAPDGAMASEAASRKRDKEVSDLCGESVYLGEIGAESGGLCWRFLLPSRPRWTEV
jgi:hypothetical protein